MSLPITALRERRRELLLILATVVFSAFSVNLLSSYVSAYFSQRPSVSLFLGLVFALITAILIGPALFSTKDLTVRINGAVAYQQKNNTVTALEIIGYEFNRDFCRYLNAFLNENKAYAKIFTENSKSTMVSSAFEPDDLNHHTIMNSVLEFVVLHKLDLHLNSFFVENEIDKTKIITLNRDHLGVGVLKNRVIDLITRDMRERPAFSESKSPKGGITYYPNDDESEGVVVSSYGKNGVVYQRLSIELPPKSKIFRNKMGFLVISNNLFNITIMPKYEGYITTLPSSFMPNSDDFFTPSLVKLIIKIQIKRRAFTMGSSLQDYEWLDSFVTEMAEYMDTDLLEKRLNPGLIQILKRQA